MELLKKSWRSGMAPPSPPPPPPLLLLLLLLLPLAGSQGHSGDSDVESRISCTSHISTRESSLTCQLLPGTHRDRDRDQDRDDEQDQDEDQDLEADCIEHMRLCFMDWADRKKTRCWTAVGDTIRSRDLLPVADLNLTVDLRRGGSLWTTVDLRKIVKPRTPEVWDVALDPEAGQVLVYVRAPYQNDYLSADNQMFQVFLSSSAENMTLNLSSHHVLSVHLRQLQPGSAYGARVRSLPQVYLQGSWSAWSSPVHFTTPPAEGVSEAWAHRWEPPVLTVCLVVVVVITSSLVILQRDRICSHMWPRVPHPKHTLLHLYTPNPRQPDLLLPLQPDVFSALRIFSGEPPQHTDLFSSWSSSSGHSAQEESTQPLPGNSRPEEVKGQQQEEVKGQQQQEEEEAYVTMSSFYGQKEKRG